MEFSLDLVKSTGAVVGAPVRKEITWYSDDKQHSAWVNIRLSSYATALVEFDVQREGNDVLVSRVVAAIVDPQGLPVFTTRDITGDPETGEGKLCASLFISLVAAINEANGFTVAAAKN